MKTNLLKWDVNIQGLMIVTNALFVCIAFIIQDVIMLLLALQLLTAIYQLVSSGVNLRLQHKSIGYQNFRLTHFWGTLAYLVLLYLFQYVYATRIPDILWPVVVVFIPQVIFMGYFALCYSELKYLQHNEFHILR